MSEKSNTSNNISYIVNANGDKTHVIIPYETYENLLRLEVLLKDDPRVQDNDIYTLNIKGFYATGFPTGSRENPKFMVKQNSEACENVTYSMRPPVKSLRKTLIDQGILKFDVQKKCYIFTEDYLFSSPSFAVCVIIGSSRSGLDAWVNKDGFSLKASGYGTNKKVAYYNRPVENQNPSEG